MYMLYNRSLTLLAVFSIMLFSLSRASAYGDTPQTPQLEQNPIAVLMSAPISTFNYQGQLNDGGNPANGTYDFQFTLWDNSSAGAQVGSPMIKEDIAVANGAFAVSLDFGVNAFPGSARYLEVHVRLGSSAGEFTLLSPRQAVSAVPYAIHAAHTLSATQLRSVTGSPVDTVAVNKGLYFNQSTNAADGLPFARLEEVWGMRFNSPDTRFVLSTATALLVGYAPGAQQWGAGNLLVSGNVGIGTSAPTQKFHVVADGAVGLFESSGSEAYLRLTTREGFDNRVEITNRPGGKFTVWTPGSGDALSVTRDGNIGIGTTEPRAKLDVNGRVRTGVLEITGGADLAEPFEVTDEVPIQPGMVVAIDVDHPGQLHIADHAYDKRVAGVVSGAGGISPGLLLQQQGTIAAGAHPIALTGRVYVWADSAYGAIEPGDLLTTSATPGHAMKAADNEQAGGAILGKAMTQLEAGKGLVLVLVTLQ